MIGSAPWWSYLPQAHRHPPSPPQFCSRDCLDFERGSTFKSHPRTFRPGISHNAWQSTKYSDRCCRISFIEFKLCSRLAESTPALWTIVPSDLGVKIVALNGSSHAIGTASMPEGLSGLKPSDDTWWHNQVIASAGSYSIFGIPVSQIKSSHWKNMKKPFPLPRTNPKTS